MSKTLVIVESPAKAKTIGRFLGPDYNVQASFGHIRDLPENAKDIPAEFKGKKWARLGVNVESEFEPIYVVSADKQRHVTNLRAASKTAERVLLATDEDREGESISWHILEVLKPKKSVTVQRIVFHEITEEAIKEAIANPRSVDQALVKAQETRRILDRLYGYTLSPLLWKKVGPKLSAGRVQSVATRLTVLRERERRDFVISAYSGVLAHVQAAKGNLEMKLERIGESGVAGGGDFASTGELTSQSKIWLKRDDAEELAPRLGKAKPWVVTSVDAKPGFENPPVPFMTSTLQQEASRQLGYPPRRTMQIAQGLYEGVEMGAERTGLITYMRTDSLTLADRAIKEAREVIAKKYGNEYLPDKPKQYKSKAKNAQEAHEAIRPTELSREPQSVRQYLTDEQYNLYNLIWKRTIACQMVPARVERTTVEVEVTQGKPHTFRAAGKSIVFPGFLRAYVEGSDDPEADLENKEKILPEVKVGETLEALKVVATHHETKPPARYTEASLVKKLEEEGVGRPSTYASILGTIQDRGYINKRKNELIPTFTAFAVIELLENNFNELVDLKFTAKMEDELDEIAGGERSMVQHLHDFYTGTEGHPGIEQEVNSKGADIPFPAMPIGEDIVVRIGRNGPFLQRGDGGPGNTASIPDEIAPAELDVEMAKKLFENRASGPEVVGTDPGTGRDVYYKSGRFGDYLEVAPKEGEDPKRVTIPPGTNGRELSEVDLAGLLSFPKNLGKHPESGEDTILALGRYGAYLTAGQAKANVGDWREATKLDLAQAVKAIAEGGASRRPMGAAEPLRELGNRDGLAGPVKVMSGRFGPYVTDGQTNATLPKSIDPMTVTVEQAGELLKAKAAAGPAKKPFARKKPAPSRSGQGQSKKRPAR